MRRNDRLKHNQGRIRILIFLALLAVYWSTWDCFYDDPAESFVCSLADVLYGLVLLVLVLGTMPFLVIWGDRVQVPLPLLIALVFFVVYGVAFLIERALHKLLMREVVFGDVDIFDVVFGNSTFAKPSGLAIILSRR